MSREFNSTTITVNVLTNIYCSVIQKITNYTDQPFYMYFLIINYK